MDKDVTKKETQEITTGMGESNYVYKNIDSTIKLITEPAKDSDVRFYPVKQRTDIQPRDLFLVESLPEDTKIRTLREQKEPRALFAVVGKPNNGVKILDFGDGKWLCETDDRELLKVAIADRIIKRTNSGLTVTTSLELAGELFGESTIERNALVVSLIKEMDLEI